MKIKINTNLTIKVIVISFVLTCAISAALLYLGTGLTMPFKPANEFNNWSNTKLKPIDSVISTDLPYSKYISLRDSIKTTRDLINGIIPVTGGTQFGYVIGTTGNYISCDTGIYKSYWYEIMHSINPKHIQYYIKLPGWMLKATVHEYSTNDSVEFYREHNKAYIRKQVLNKTIKSKTGLVDNYFNLIDKPVKFGYNQREKCLLIPVNHSTEKTVDIILIILNIGLGLYILYLISCFFSFIADLSKGLSFTNANVFRLKLITISLLIYSIGEFLSNFLMKLIFYNYFITDIVLNNEAWSNSLKAMIVGIIFLLLYKAFRQGKILKEEQDLTV